MLPFGSITSVVPLVVLGFAYLVYLGAILLNKPAIDEFPPNDAAVMNIIEADANGETTFTIPDFRSLTGTGTDAIISVDDNIIDWSQFLSFIAEIPPARPLVLHNVSQFLPRPPPAG